MREIKVKYDGECSKCGTILEIGSPAMYEKYTGIFCIGCEPTDIEEIRAYRQAKADIKADKYDEWANKKEERATTQLNSYPDIRHDIAFNTQPGHIPFRARMIKADDRAFENLQIAEKMRDKANNLRQVRVVGDAERKRELERQRLDTLISKGSRVESIFFGPGEVIGIYKKSYRIKYDRGFTHSEEKTFVKPLTV